MNDDRKRLKPDIQSLVTLDDLLWETRRSREIQESMIEEGIIEPLWSGTQHTVTITPIVVTPPRLDKHWFGVKIWNDGLNDLWVHVNTEKGGNFKILAGEHWGTHNKTAVITDIRLYTDSGSTVVRIQGER